MESKTIKVSEETYRWLARLAAEVQKARGTSISFDEALSTLKPLKGGKSVLLGVAGTWKMNDAEAEEFEKENKKLWKTWKLPSA